MESITEIILGYFFGLASNLHADAILTAQKKKLIKQLQTDEKAREALRAFCPYAEDVRLACLQLAEKHELLRSSPAAKRLSGLLTDSRFHSDFLEWLQAGDIEEGDAVKARMLKQMEKILGRTAVSNEQLDFLQNDFFTALDKAIFADPILARWRFDLSLRYLREKVAELQRLAKENAGIYSELQQQRVLDLYCQKALDAWDIIDLSNLPEGDLHMATQKFLLRQLYMPLRISFSKASRDPHDDAQLNGLEDVREKRRLIDAGRTDSMDAAELAAMQTAMPVGERLNSCQRLVILGDPGAGKTTMLRWLATAYLLRHIADPALDQIPDVQTLPPQAWIPVLIRCRDIGPKDLCRSFTDVLSIHLSKTELLPDDAKIMGAIILDRIAKGEILLLVDGLDEITDRQDRIMFCEELERMAARYPEAPILVTSRIVGYRDMPYRMRTGFEHGVISDLQAEDKDQFARRWVEVTESYQTRLDRDRSARELIDALHSTVRIERLTGNPMLLTTLALVKRKVGKLPTRRNKLYAEAITVLLNWNPRVYDRIEDDEALPQLAYLAHEMCRRGVQRLTEDDVLDLLDQIRNDYPNIRPVGRRNSQEFLKRIEERSSLLMRSGHVWRPNNPHEKTVWEFRHLTFQEYLAARALLDGRYKDRDKTKTLAAQVAPLAAPAAGKRNNRAEASVDGSDRSNKPASVPDSWREALRLLVSDCKDDDVDDVLQGILQPGAGEDAAISRHPRAVLAAQCLAEEPNVSEEMASQVLEQFVSLLGQEEGIGELTTNLERAALEVWQSSWMGRLQTTLIQAFSEGSADRRANCGGVLAQLLAGGLPGAPADWDDNFEALLSSLQSPDPEQAICAALTVVQLGYQGWPARPAELCTALLALLARQGPQAHAAAWALAWLNVNPASAASKDGSRRRSRLAPPLFQPCCDETTDTGWQPTAQEAEALVAALQRAEASQAELKGHLIGLLGRGSQPGGLLPLLQTLDDPLATVRARSREALAWWATHLPSCLSCSQLDVVEEQVAARLLNNCALREAERADGLVVLALFGCEGVLRQVLEAGQAAVALRRRAAEGLGLLASRCGDGRQRARIRSALDRCLRSDALNLLVSDEAGWAEHDRRLPLLQGASRGLQLAAAADLRPLGEAPCRPLPMLTLTALSEGQGLRLRTEVVERAVWTLPLPEGELLELVMVPAGEHWIGSAGLEQEARRVLRLESFAMARHPITQAQWRAVASLPQLERHLSPDPGRQEADGLWERYAQPGGLPVDSVSWHDCQEWLKRLQQWLGAGWTRQGGQGDPPRVALPGEGQWEAACRAGTHTPFHFGDTLDASWANFDATHTHGSGRRRPDRQRLASAGAFGLVNRWGLAEMHGQLWEWCGDRWRSEPTGEGWPNDGRPWDGPDPALKALGTGEEMSQEALGPVSGSSSLFDQNLRLLRGGSWFSHPWNCRSADRIGWHQGGRNDDVGFRLCVFPPGSLLGS